MLMKSLMEFILLICQIYASFGIHSQNLSKSKVHVEHMNDTSYAHHDDAVDHFVTGSSKRLTEFLMATHNRYAPPDGIVDIKYELELVHILGIDELKQTMTALVYVDETWRDPSLSWNPRDFGGLTKTWLPMHKVWRPDLIVFNMLHHEDLLSSVRAPVTVHQNGTVECSSPAVFTVSCEINIKMFPLDDQKCSLNIASWAYSDEKIRLHSKIEHSLDHYAPNEEWHLLGVDVRENKYEHEGIPVSEIIYDISVKRKPLFYMVTLTFPSYVMCATAIVGLFARFSTTGEREERFTLGVSGILTMAVLSLVVSEKVPHSSTSVPLLVTYFLYNMVTVSIASITTGIVMRIHRKGRFGDEPPSWLLNFCWLSEHGQHDIAELESANAKQTNDFMFGSPILGQTKDANSTRYVKGNLIRKATSENELHFEIRESVEDAIQGNNVIFNSNAIHSPSSINEPILKKLSDLETLIGKLVAKKTGKPLDQILKRQDSWERKEEIRKKKQENNGWVRISERMDGFFMVFFLLAVTTPVLYLFICMFSWAED
uniref:Uncharacterized protein n=1 Tax=Panagrolaimus sp. JU765 TaxID=591449 RepID=A0AC34Q8Q8_9BILA